MTGSKTQSSLKLSFKTEYLESPNFEISVSSEIFSAIAEYGCLTQEVPPGGDFNPKVKNMVEYFKSLQSLIPERISLDQVVHFIEILAISSSGITYSVPLAPCESVKIVGVTKVQADLV